MDHVASLSREWLVLTIPGCVGGIALIVASVALLLRTIRVQQLARLPLAATSELELESAGPLSFLIDKPRFRNVQAAAFKPFSVTIGLEDAQGRVRAADPVLIPLTVEGVGRLRTEIATLPVTEPGSYRLHVAGLAASVDQSDAFLFVARPTAKLKFVASVLSIILGSALALGGLIASVATFVEFQSG